MLGQEVRRGVVAPLQSGPVDAALAVAEDLLKFREADETIAVVARRTVVEQSPPEIEGDGPDFQEMLSNFGERLARNAAAPSAGSPLA
jgi:hypothetical protein